MAAIKWFVPIFVVLVVVLGYESCNGDRERREAEGIANYTNALHSDEIARAELELDDANAAAELLSEVARQPGATDLQREMASLAANDTEKAKENLDAVKRAARQ